MFSNIQKYQDKIGFIVIWVMMLGLAYHLMQTPISKRERATLGVVTEISDDYLIVDIRNTYNKYVDSTPDTYHQRIKIDQHTSVFTHQLVMLEDVITTTTGLHRRPISELQVGDTAYVFFYSGDMLATRIYVTESELLF